MISSFYYLDFKAKFKETFDRKYNEEATEV